MKALALGTIASVAKGELNNSASALDSEVLATGFSVDSRQIEAGDVFVATRGERVDGHDFAAQALERGAIFVLSERDIPEIPCVVVGDCVVALGLIASWYRHEVLSAQVIGLTGSSGKTTTKDIIAQVLDGQVVAAPGSFNTEIGLPLTVLEADPETDFLVLEMGMRGLGHIQHLVEVADPDIAAVLNVGTAHVGMMEAPGDIARAKGELVEGLRPDAVAVLNADDPQVKAMQNRTLAETIFFGEQTGVDIQAIDVRIDDQGRPRFDLSVRGDSIRSVQLTMHGEHFVSSALAAAAVAHAAGISTDVIAERLSKSRIVSPWRMEVRESHSGVTVINDAYNANPESMRAALKALRSMSGGRRTWAVLGEMRELGERSVSEHDAIGRLAVRLDISRLVCIGTETKVMHLAASNEGSWGDESVWVPDVAAVIELLDAQVKPGDVVLVKASRAIGLEEVAEHLLRDNEAPS